MIAQRPDRDVSSLQLLPHEPRIDALISQLATLGGLPQPSSSAHLEQWPAEVINQAAARVQAIGVWLAANAALAPADPALRLASTMLLAEVALIASFLRSTTNGAIAELDRIQRTLAAARREVDQRPDGPAHAPNRS